MRRYLRHQSRRAAQLHVLAWIMEEDRARKLQPPGFGDLPAQALEQDVLVDRDEEVGEVALQIPGRPLPVLGDRTHLVLEQACGVERAAARDAGAAGDVERGVEARRDAVVQQVVRDPVGEGRCPHLAGLGPRDDEAGAAARPPGAGGELLVQRPEVCLCALFKCEGAGAVALAAAAVEPRLNQLLERVGCPIGA